MELDSDDDDDIAVAWIVMSTSTQILMLCDSDLDDNDEGAGKPDHRTLPRAARRKFNHERALQCIREDWLVDSEFKRQFQVSRGMFEVIAQRMADHNPQFYTTKGSAHKQPIASIQAKILLPLKSIRHGVAPSAFGDYFQMSETLSDKARDEFLDGFVHCFKDPYMRVMTAKDVRSITLLHHYIHGVEGVGLSLDCMRTSFYHLPLVLPKRFYPISKKCHCHFSVLQY